MKNKIKKENKFQRWLIKIGVLKESKVVYENCLNCGKKLEGKQSMFCKASCGSYYYNVKTKVKEIRRNEKK
jgi:hypothetical protein